jgi:hypothetical protein
MNKFSTWEDIDDVNNKIDFFINNQSTKNQVGGDGAYKLVAEHSSLYSKFNYTRRILKYEINNQQYKSFYEAEDGAENIYTMLTKR